MNNVQDMFSALFKPFNRSTSVEQHHHERDRSPVTENGCHGNDIEEDDFLLVGQTRSERTTVTARQFSNKIDCPPDYNRAVSVSEDDQNLPSYAEYSSSQKEYSPWLGAKENGNTTNQNSTIMEYSDNSGSLTAISDIPFSLSPELQLRMDLMKNSIDTALIREDILDLSKYSYDFSVEISVIQEHDMR